MWEQVVRLHALINGGAAVALLAFIQAIWVQAPELVCWVVVSLIVFSLGLVLTSLIPRLREMTALYWKSDRPKAKKYQRYYRGAAKLSVVLFMLGVAIVSIGILANLPDSDELRKQSATEEQQPQSND